MDKNMLARATSYDDSPTPGYMYGEISKMTLISYEACKQLEDYLIARLKKNNHNVKYKSLMIIKHVCRTGRPEFKRDMQRQTEPIRDCLQYRGPPDPLRGDTIYKRVHEVAKETLDAIYDSEGSSCGSVSAVAARIEGFGSAPPPLPPQQTSSGSLGGIADTVTSVMGAVTHKIDKLALGGATASTPALSSYSGPEMVGPPSSSSNFSSSSYVGPGPVRSTMQGFGNPNFQDARLASSSSSTTSILQKAGELVRSQLGNVVNTAQSLAASNNRGNLMPPVPSGPVSGDYSYATNRGPTANNWTGSGGLSSSGSTGVYSMPAPPVNTNTEAVSSYNQARNTQAFQWSKDGGTQRTAGSIGGVWGSVQAPNSQGVAAAPGASPSPYQSGAVAPSSSTTTSSYPSTYPLAPQGPLKAGRVGGAASDGEYEKHVVLELCAPGGTRAVPPKDKLDEFIVNVKNLNVDLVGGIILDQLGEESWQVKSKALHVIEAIIKSSGIEDFKHFFQDNAGELETLLNDNKATVRDKALKILRSLGINVDPSSAQGPPKTTSSTLTTSSSMEDNGEALLDLLDDSPPVAPPVPGPAPLADMLSSVGPSVQAPPPVDLFSGMTMASTSQPPPPPPPPSVPTQPLDLFSDLGIKGATTTSSPPKPAPPTAPSPNLLDDLGLSPSPSPPPITAPAVNHQKTSSTTVNNDLLLLAEPVSQPSGPLNSFDPLARGARSNSNPVTGPATLPGGFGAVMGVAPPPNMGQPPIRSLGAGVPPTNLGRMGQGMIPALQPRTIIPSAEEGDTNSAFSFIAGGGGGAGKAPGGQQSHSEDAFNFVKEAMKTS